MPTSAFAFITLSLLVAWVAVAGGASGAGDNARGRRLPAVGPAPLAAFGTTSSKLAPPLDGGVITDALPAKGGGVTALHDPTSSAATTLLPSGSTVDDFAAASALAQDGIPITALLAYKQAAARESGLDPSCGLTWPLLAAIGRVESDHGRFGGAVLHADGLSTPPIIGPALNGHGTALILDTDNGRLDGDTVYDHAVGPMQFIPSTWASWGVDANHDGVANPFNIFDAAAAAADYLCAAGGNLTTYAGQARAVRSYNDSNAYIALVLSMERIYAAGAGIIVPVAPGTGASGPTSKSTLPPVNPGPPPGVHRRHPSRSPSSSAPSSPSRSPSSSPSTPSTSTVPSTSGAPSSSGSSSPSKSPSRSPSSSPPGCPSSSSSSSRSPSSSTSSSSSGCPSSSSSSSPSGSRSTSGSSAAPSSSGTSGLSAVAVASGQP
jgi:membrane-bound lytic murein transglycosylase B